MIGVSLSRAYVKRCWRPPQATLLLILTMRYDLDATYIAAMEHLLLQPDDPQRRNTLRIIQVHRGQCEEALALSRQILADTPLFPRARAALAEVLLATGRLAEGWCEWAQAMEDEAPLRDIPQVTTPRWDGHLPTGGRLLLINDQGNGDAIQFARYIPFLARRFDQVFLGCAKPLISLLSTIDGVSACLASYQSALNLPHDISCLLSTVPAKIGVLRFDEFATPFYVRAQQPRVVYWRQKLASAAPVKSLKVGIAWAGNPDHKNDANRSIPTAFLAPIAAVDVTLVSVQPNIPKDWRMTFPGLVEFGSRLQDFADTAALLESLDLLVTVDTAVAHLAGALGRPCWLMLATPSDWRWQGSLDTTFWYPSLRLFRQPHPGDWKAVIDAVIEAFSEL